jgi:hypothetical protein
VNVSGVPVTDFAKHVRDINWTRYVPTELKRVVFSESKFGDVWRVLQTDEELIAEEDEPANWCWYTMKSVGLRGRGRASDSISLGSFVTVVRGPGDGDVNVFVLRVESIVGVRVRLDMRDLSEVFVRGKMWMARDSVDRVGMLVVNSSVDVVESGAPQTVPGREFNLVAMVIHQHRFVVLSL